MNIHDRAIEFAKRAHGDQKRKYTGEPYWHHPLEVMNYVKTVTHDTDVHVAAMLHDVLEDTPITALQIFQEFGNRVAELVLEVTDVSRPEHGNRTVRKEMDRQHLARSSPEGATIKLADMFSNSKDIMKNDPNFAVVYLREKALVLPLLRHGNETLWQMCFEILRDYDEDRLKKHLEKM